MLRILKEAGQGLLPELFQALAIVRLKNIVLHVVWTSAAAAKGEDRWDQEQYMNSSGTSRYSQSHPDAHLQELKDILPDVVIVVCHPFLKRGPAPGENCRQLLQAFSHVDRKGSTKWISGEPSRIEWS